MMLSVSRALPCLLQQQLGSGLVSLQATSSSSSRWYSSKEQGDEDKEDAIKSRRRGKGRYGVRLLRADEEKFRRMRAILGYGEQQQTADGASASPSRGARAASNAKSEASAPSTAGGAKQVTISMLQTMHYLDFPLSYRQQLAAYRIGTLSIELSEVMEKTRKGMLEAWAAEQRSSPLPGLSSLLGGSK